MTAVALSRLTVIDPRLIKRPTARKADGLITAEAVARTNHGDRWAHYLVQGSHADAYRVRLEIDETVWSGQCSHYAVLGIIQARNARACSHILAAAAAEMDARDVDLPNPHHPRPATADGARRAQRDREMEGFYGD